MKSITKSLSWGLILIFIFSFTMNTTVTSFENQNETSTFPQAASDGWNNVTLPDPPIPETNLTFVHGSEEIQISLANLINYTTYENQTFPMYNYSIEVKEITYELIGFNPIFVFELLGWTDLWNFTLSAGDGYSKAVSMDLLLMDGDWGDIPASVNATMIVIAWGGQWLADYDNDYGDFYMWGENLAGSQKVKDIISLTYSDPWEVKIFVNNVLQAAITTADSDNSVLNFTTYDWGYFDEVAGYGWDERSCTGFTIDSLISLTNITSENYNISLVGYDGYGADKNYTRTQMEDGFTGYMINDPEKELSNEGKQAMLMIQQDGEDLGYSRGAFHLVVPGASKKNYIGGIVEIRITVEFEDRGIPGFSIGIMLVSMAAMVVGLSHKYNNQHK
ncbi:MAG: hypothetical protein ACTSYI_02725 [Promethearchaeota archaeon]